MRLKQILAQYNATVKEYAPLAPVLVPVVMFLALVVIVLQFTSRETLAAVPLWTILVAIPLGLCAVGLSTGYWEAKPGEAIAPGSQASLWHLTSDEGLMAAVPGTSIALEPKRCRLIALCWRSDRPWKRPRKAVYVFSSKPTQDAIVANLSKRRRGALLELDPAGLSQPWLVRKSAVASPGGFSGTLVSVQVLAVPSPPQRRWRRR